MVVIDLVYLAAAPFALPFLAIKSRRTGKYQSGVAERFGLGVDEIMIPRREKRGAGKVLLLHCVSVGELNSVETLIRRLLASDPHLWIAVTTTTDSGMARARKLYPAHEAARTRVFATRFPFDFSFAVERLFERIEPDAIALVELETWPNFLSIARSRRIPVALINGRLTGRSYPKYRLIRPVMAAMLGQLEWIGVQTPEIAGRFIGLGANPAKVRVLPTLKYDAAPRDLGAAVMEREALAAAMGLDPGHQLIVAGSIAAGEERLLLNSYGELRDRLPRMRMALVPRHPETIPIIVNAIEAHGFTPVLRSRRPDAAARPADAPSAPPAVPSLGSSDIFVLDTFGELRKLYALACGVFLGRSLVKKGGGGSDMIEAAALGKPTCFGPYTHNFTEVVELLTCGGGAVEIHNEAELTQTLGSWLTDREAANEMGNRARELIRGQQGSTEAYAAALLALTNEMGNDRVRQLIRGQQGPTDAYAAALLALVNRGRRE